MSNPFSVLLTNDDGIGAPGILALKAAFNRYKEIDIYIVAPDRERSTCSHGMTLLKAVKTSKISERVYAVDGLPADCVYLAINGLFPKPPDIVVSGINRGANLGSDVIFSGTVAGARQAALMGIHGIAVSLVNGDDYREAARMTVEVTRQIAEQKLVAPILLNLNFPNENSSHIQFGCLGRRNYPQNAEVLNKTDDGITTYQIGGPYVEDALLPSSDGLLVSRGIASATLLSTDQTDYLAMSKASNIFETTIFPLTFKAGDVDSEGEF